MDLAAGADAPRKGVCSLAEVDEDWDQDGIPNRLEGCREGRDSDGDGTPDWQDFDSDSDEITDRHEAGARGSDGRCTLGGPWPCDSDGDGTPDYLDQDSDNDGRRDGVEDRNGDGKLGCCLERCGETRRECHGFIGVDGCGPRQVCVEGSCDADLAGRYRCALGETSPRLADTFGDGRSDDARGLDVCDEAARVPLRRTALGEGWKLLLPLGVPLSWKEVRDYGFEGAAAFGAGALQGALAFVRAPEVGPGAAVEERSLASTLAIGMSNAFVCIARGPRCAFGVVPHNGDLSELFVQRRTGYGTAAVIEPLGLALQVGPRRLSIGSRDLRYEHGSAYLETKPRLSVPKGMVGQGVALVYDDWSSDIVDCPGGP